MAKVENMHTMKKEEIDKVNAYISALAAIRRKTGYRHTEAVNFYRHDPSNWEARLKTARVRPPTNEEKIRAAINKYYLALDKREHGAVAQNMAFMRIEQILGMCWEPGEQLKKQNV